ncbi:MAG: hypothetical protein CMD23_02375 [Flavobacteriales bacterium]|nr:hypothetical protein [Flavobacteriales bacterium]
MLSLNLYSQNNKVIAGPMVSFIDSYGTQMWFLLESDTEKITVDVRDYDTDKLMKYEFDVQNKHRIKDYIPFTIVLEKLQPNKEYIASVSVDSVFVKEMDIFTKRPHLDDVQLLIGSDYPESDVLQNSNLFPLMAKTNSDFMVWLGNYVEFSAESLCETRDFTFAMDNMLDQYVAVRKNPYLNYFMSSMPQIATWGSSDFCNVGASWNLKDTTHLVFDLFWPNSLQKTYNYTYFDYGTYQRYTYNDLDIFLLDAMTFRSDSSLYGDKQLERMFQEIQNTGATFTILASPAPFTFDSEDSFLNYKKEFDYFLYRLNLSSPSGLILVSTSGDVNTELNRYDMSNKMILSDGQFNCDKCLYEFNFPSMLNGSYSLISITGKKRNRLLSFESYDSNGNIIYKKELHQKHLSLN